MHCEIPYEELSALAGGELDRERAAELREHVAACGDCRRRLAELGQIDEILKALPPVLPPAEAVLAARRALAREIRPVPALEIMTLEEVAEFLRITPQQLGEVVEELPAFELAGQIRIARQRLLEWIRQRERDYPRQDTESSLARSKLIAHGRTVA